MSCREKECTVPISLPGVWSDRYLHAVWITSGVLGLLSSEQILTRLELVFLLTMTLYSLHPTRNAFTVEYNELLSSDAFVVFRVSNSSHVLCYNCVSLFQQRLTRLRRDTFDTWAWWPHECSNVARFKCLVGRALVAWIGRMPSIQNKCTSATTHVWRSAFRDTAAIWAGGMLNFQSRNLIAYSREIRFRCYVLCKGMYRSKGCYWMWTLQLADGYSSNCLLKTEICIHCNKPNGSTVPILL